MTKGGLHVSADGLVHTTFTHDPSTFRLASKAPAMQNIPPSARMMFVAPPGYAFWAVDYAGIENILVGWLAKSDRYVRLSKLDMHSFFTAHVLCEIEKTLPSSALPQESWPDAELKQALRYIKDWYPKQRQANKPHIHGSNYMEGPTTIQEGMLKDLGVVVPLKQLKRLQGFYFELFPEIRQWHRRATGLEEVADPKPGEGAYQKGYLRTPFGNIHRYYDVLTHIKGPRGWELRYSTDAKRAVAFVPQSSARMVLTRAAQRFDLDVQDTLRLFIHDEVLGLCRDTDGARCVQHARTEMERPVPELGGLALPTEAKTGRSWGDMR